MCKDAEAAKVAAEYAKVVNYAAAKAYRKWRGYLFIRGDSAAFKREDIRQAALEGMLLMAGLMPTRKHKLNGALNELLAEGGEGYVQHRLDLYVSGCLAHAVEAARATSRGGDENPTLSLDATDEEGMTIETTQHVGAVETSGQALANVRERWPILCATEIDGLSMPDAIKHFGMSLHRYREARVREKTDFRAWAVANRRVALDLIAG